MKTLVGYRSKYGTTARYARWIAESLQGELVEIGKEKPNEQLTEYDVIIYGGGIYAGGIDGISFLTKNYDKIKGKSLILFTVGLADPEKKEQFTDIIDKNLTPEMRQNIKVFHLRGGINYQKLSIPHKIMMSMVKHFRVKMDEPMDEEQLAFMETYGKQVDFTDRQSITSLVDHVTNLMNR